MTKHLLNSAARLLAAVCLATGMAARTETAPLATWNFDTGRNLDAETGMTEFSRAKIPVFPGLKSREAPHVQLLANQQVDPGRLFVASRRGMAMRSGVDNSSEAVFGASARLPFMLSRNEGTIAFWLSPEDWDGAQKGKFHIFLAANDDASPRTNELLLYMHGGASRLRFLIGDNDVKRWCIADCDIRNWKRGQWHFVCAAWTPDDMTLAVDGEVVQRPRPRLPAHDYHILHLGTRGWANEGGLTLLDDVAVFPRALKREEMDAYRVQTRPVVTDRASPLTHLLGPSTPVLDGMIAPFEYGATLNSTFNLDSGELSADSRWAAAYDADNLYFAWDTMLPVRMPSVTRHDGNVWEDESIELHLEFQERQWQFIVNAAGTVYDARDRSSTWNARNLRIKQRQDGTRWVVELALSFADLGIAPRTGDNLFFALGRSSVNTGHTAAAPLARRFDDRGNFIKAVLDQEAPPVELSFQTLPGSEGRLALAVMMPAGHHCTFWLLGCDSRGRKLYEHTAASTQSEKRTKVEVHAIGLAKEGTVAYTLAENGRLLAQAEYKYLSPERLKIRCLLVHAETQTLETMLSLTPPLPAEQPVIQLLKDKAGRIALCQDGVLGPTASEKYSVSLTWDLSSLPPGDYDYYLATAEDGQEKILHHQYFQKPGETTAWTDFRGGIETTAPSPWHAPRHVGTTLECLTQTYDFGGRLLPSQILAQGVPLLERPVTLRLNGQTLDLPATWEVTQETPLETHFRTRTRISGLDFKVEGVLEYDGWLRLAMTFSSSDPACLAVVEDLALVIPMSPDASRLVTSFVPQYATLPSGRLDRRCHSDLIDHPVFWVGNADRGLFWGADSMRGTHLASTAESLVITPASVGSGATAVVRLVDARLVLAVPRTFEFGLQATPVKPLRRLPRPWMFRGGDTIASGPPWKFFHIFNYANPAYIDRAEAHRQVAAARSRTPIYGIYGSIYGVSPFCPEWPWHCEKWISSPPGPGQFKQDYPTNDEQARNQGVWAFGCVADQDFLNWQLYDKYTLIQDREVGLRDMYIDMGYPRACDNPRHGCGWRDDFGRPRKTYPINANRTFTKRLRKLLRDKDKDSVLMYHASDETLPPVCGLVDFTFDGELYVADVARAENYYDILTPPLVQSSFTGVQTGTNAVYVSQLNRAAMLHNPARSEYWRRKVKAPEAVRAVRHLLGYCLLHDIRPQAGAGIYHEGEILERQLYSLGYGTGNFEFHPYWHKDGPVVCNGSPLLLLSAFHFASSKTLAVVLNDSKTDEVQATLALRDGQAHRIYDLETGKDITFPVKVQPKGFRLIVFEQ